MRNPATGSRGPDSPERTVQRLRAAMGNLVDRTPSPELQWTEQDRRRAGRQLTMDMFAEMGLDPETAEGWVMAQCEEDMENMSARAALHPHTSSADLVRASLAVAYTVGLQVGLLLGSKTE